uniref:Uncharacterized protein n=1 Tax=Zea mays TaxID=4577 RepID=B4FZG2_MAIZE|nr:unknown [Zea mays]
MHGVAGRQGAQVRGVRELRQFRAHATRSAHAARHGACRMPLTCALARQGRRLPARRRQGLAKREYRRRRRRRQQVSGGARVGAPGGHPGPSGHWRLRDALWMGLHHGGCCSRCAHGNLALFRRAIYQRAAHRARAWRWGVRRCDEANRKCFECYY